jgi:hypothetical protein
MGGVGVGVGARAAHPVVPNAKSPAGGAARKMAIIRPYYSTGPSEHQKNFVTLAIPNGKGKSISAPAFQKTQQPLE